MPENELVRCVVCNTGSHREDWQGKLNPACDSHTEEEIKAALEKKDADAKAKKEADEKAASEKQARVEGLKAARPPVPPPIPPAAPVVTSSEVVSPVGTEVKPAVAGIKKLGST